MNRVGYLLLADTLLLIHVIIVLFIVLGLVLIWIGYWRQWRWVHNKLFRLAHLAAIAFVTIQTWFGKLCPLTVWEMALREKAGDAVYAGSFVAHWLNQLLYFEAPLWVFAVAYTLFAALVVLSWFLVKPGRF